MTERKLEKANVNMNLLMSNRNKNTLCILRFEVTIIVIISYLSQRRNITQCQMD